MISRIHLNIGSNSGDSRAFIARAVAALRSAFAGELRVSREVVSEPWGFVSANNFINVGVMITVHRAEPWMPAELDSLLADVKAIERSISVMPHRDASGAYADREIDIDIIAVDDICHASPVLVIPHPLMAKREFVLGPLAELAPDWRHPQTALTAAEMLGRL